jgi:hypothetical protein
VLSSAGKSIKCSLFRSRDIVVVIRTSYLLYDRTVESPGRVKDFLLSTSSRQVFGPIQPTIRWVAGALSPGVKQSEREIDHSTPASAEVKNMSIYTSTPHTLSWRIA